MLHGLKIESAESLAFDLRSMESYLDINYKGYHNANNAGTFYAIYNKPVWSRNNCQ